MVGTTTRTYLVHVPASYIGAPVPLVVDMHGLTSTAEQQRAISGFLALSNTRGFIATWPQGLGNAWNGGICCSTANDDVAFIRALVAKMKEEAAIDARRVYATGLSNGGAMTHRLACEAADLFAAAAPVSFPISVSPLSSCVPSRKIPVLTFMGLTDTVVAYNGGTFPSAAVTFDHWRSVDQCGTGTPETHNVSGASFCDIDLSCAPGVQVGLCSITGSQTPAPFAGHILYINAGLSRGDPRVTTSCRSSRCRRRGRRCREAWAAGAARGAGGVAAGEPRERLLPEAARASARRTN